MKLHTDFHDYYDTAVGFGIDEKVHYNRFTKIVEKQMNIKTDLPIYREGKSLLLGFCGQIYPIVVKNTYDENNKLISTDYAYSYEELFAISLKNKKWIGWGLWWQRKNRTDKEVRKLLTKHLAKDRIIEFYNEWNKQDDSLFLTHKVPVWLLNLDPFDKKLILNPKLEDLEFCRIKDANMAFQEISGYLSNILVEQKETAIIEDKYLIENHGFDLKTSFRKDKKAI